MRSVLLGLHMTLLTVLAMPDRSMAWEVRLDDESECVYGMTRDGVGDVIASSGAGTVKLARRSGAVLWRRPLDGQSVFAPLPGNDIVIAGGGSVSRVIGATGIVSWTHQLPLRYLAQLIAPHGGGIVVGTIILEDGVLSRQLAVRRLDASTGALQWEKALGASERGAGAHGLATASNGDVVVTSAATDGIDSNAISVWRLDGATGNQVWRRDIDGFGPDDVNSVDQVLLDAAGDVLVGGHLRNAASTDLVFLKLDGATGVEIWRHEIAGARIDDGPPAAMVGTAPNGDVLVAGSVAGTATGPGGHYIAFARLDGATGNAVWSDAIDESAPTSSERLVGFVVDSVGDVYLNATLNFPPLPAANWVVFAVSGADGSLRWRQDRPGRVENSDGLVVGTAVELGPDDELAVGGCAAIRPLPGTDEMVGIVATLTRDGADPLAGTSLIVADRAGRPSSRSVKLTTKLGTDLDVGSGADPRVGGGVLELRNPTTGELASFPLPASGWTARVGSKGLDYYSYRDRKRVFGPCTSIAIKGGSLKATCKGDQIGFTLDEASQGSLALRLTTGAGVAARRYCLAFGGDVSQDAPGSFRARDAGAPAVCPFP